MNKLLFANNTALVIDSEKLSNLVRKFGRICERMEVKVNVGKRKVLKFSLCGEQEPLRVKLGPDYLDEVSEFKYFGSMVSADGGLEAEQKQRLRERANIMGRMTACGEAKG